MSSLVKTAEIFHKPMLIPTSLVTVRHLHICPFYPDYCPVELALAVDMTARNLQDRVRSEGLPWSAAKGFDTFTPVGSAAVLFFLFMSYHFFFGSIAIHQSVYSERSSERSS